MTASLRYFPGTATLISRPGIVAFTTDQELAQRLWPAVEAGGAGQDLLEEAVRNGLSGLPDLLLIEFDGPQTRVLVRGDHAVDVHDSAGEVHSCTGFGVRTWTERLLNDTTSGSVGSLNGVGLPLLFGMVRASGFHWETTTTAVHDKTIGGRQEPINTSSSEVGVPPEPLAHQPVRAVDSARPVPIEMVPNAAAPTAETNHDSASIRVVGWQAESRSEAASGQRMAETRTEPADEGYDHLFGSTVYRSVEEAAVRDDVDQLDPLSPGGPNTVDPVDLSPPPIAVGDHDGSTIMASGLASLWSSTTDPSRNDNGPGQSRAVLELVTGERVELDRGAVIGRRPQVDRVAGGAIPRLVTVPSPQQDISRSHLQITLDGDAYVAVDLHSMNGTIVTSLDGSSNTLTAGQQRILRPGDVLDLGDGITATLQPAL